MLTYTKIVLFSLVIFALSAHTCFQKNSSSEIIPISHPIETKEQSLVSNEIDFEKCSETTRGVLIIHCGSCHQSTITSHKPGAIEIFDLDKGTNWHIDLLIENLHGIAQRTQNRDQITKEQHEAITTFLKLKESQLNR